MTNIKNANIRHEDAECHQKATVPSFLIRYGNSDASLIIVFLVEFAVGPIASVNRFVVD